MSKQRPQSPDGAPKKRPPANRTNVSLHVYIPPALRQALDELAGSNRRDVTAEVILALEAHLGAAGCWPPPDKAPPADK